MKMGFVSLSCFAWILLSIILTGQIVTRHQFSFQSAKPVGLNLGCDWNRLLKLLMHGPLIPIKSGSLVGKYMYLIPIIQEILMHSLGQEPVHLASQSLTASYSAPLRVS